MQPVSVKEWTDKKEKFKRKNKMPRGLERIPGGFFERGAEGETG